VSEFGSIFELPEDGETSLSYPQCKWLFLRSGRDAIRLSLREIGSDRVNILAPAYICSEVNDVLNENRKNVIRYSLAKSHDLKYLSSVVEDLDIDVILLQDLFNKRYTHKFRQELLIKHNKLHVIFDCTHSLPHYFPAFSAAGTNEWIVASSRKWGYNNGGGLMYSSNFGLTEYLQIDKLFENNKRTISSIKRLYLAEGSIKLNRQFLELNRETEELLRDGKVYGLSEASKAHVFSALSKNNQERRRKNINVFKSLIAKLLPDIDSSLTSLFMGVILCEDRDLVQLECAKKGLYLQVIWPLSDLDASFIEEKQISDRILCVPIDQRYSEDDIRLIVNILVEILDS
jgi:hypothetical protein